MVLKQILKTKPESKFLNVVEFYFFEEGRCRFYKVESISNFFLEIIGYSID